MEWWLRWLIIPVYSVAEWGFWRMTSPVWVSCAPSSSSHWASSSASLCARGGAPTVAPPSARGTKLHLSSHLHIIQHPIQQILSIFFCHKIWCIEIYLHLWGYFWARVSVQLLSVPSLLAERSETCFLSFCRSEQIPSPKAISFFFAHFAFSYHRTWWRHTCITDKLAFNFCDLLWPDRWTYAGQLVFFVILGAIFALTYCWWFCWVVFPGPMQTSGTYNLKWSRCWTFWEETLVLKLSWTPVQVKAETSRCRIFFLNLHTLTNHPSPSPDTGECLCPCPRVCRCLPQQDVLNLFTTEDGTGWEGFKLVLL